MVKSSTFSTVGQAFNFKLFSWAFAWDQECIFKMWKNKTKGIGHISPQMTQIFKGDSHIQFRNYFLEEISSSNVIFNM